MSDTVRRGFSLAFFFQLFLFPFFQPAFGTEYLTGSGCSVSNVGYLTEIAKEYERVTGKKVFVRGGGSVVGIEDLRNGRVDFAASCRAKDASDPDIRFVQVAWDVLVFVVNKENPVEDITLDNVRAIYAGTLTNWKELHGRSSPIKVLMSKPKKGLSGLEASTKELVLKGRDPGEFQNLFKLASTGLVEQMVEGTPDGFATTGYSSARKRNLKMLKVNGVAPTLKNIIAGNYPLRRPLYILLPQNPKPAAKDFVDFVLSAKGQSFLRTHGIVSLRDLK